ncbi:MAG TPA: nitroreductase family protein [Anaerolineales bacterium]|nr:nitroreductase family protein [Anaerolineales bacterium]
MNETIKTILERRSVRSYESTPVEKEKIDLILQCGQFAPSGMNRQPWHFTVITRRAMLDKISAENRRVMLQSPVEALRLRAEDPDFDSFRGAPMAIIVSGEDEAGYAGADCANAVENMALAAQSLGLSSCYLASFKIAIETPEGAFLLDDLRIPKGFKPMFALSLGYGNEVLGERAPRREHTITFIE